MSSPAFLARTGFCRGAALRSPCQAGEWLRVAFLCLSLTAWCLGGRGCPVTTRPMCPLFFLNVVRLFYRDIHIAGLNWENGPQCTSLITSLLWLFPSVSKRCGFLEKKIQRKLQVFGAHNIWYFNIIILKVTFWLASVDKNYIYTKLRYGYPNCSF